MNETLDRKERKARKEHHCDFCGGIIKKGDIYKWSKHICDGNIYEWHSHKECDFLCSELWDYADPDEGMDEELFNDTLMEVCRCFICPDCEEWSDDFHDCVMDNVYCIDKAYEYFQTHELYRAKRGTWGWYWKTREKKTGGSCDCK